MRIAIAGATGLLGRKVVAAAQAAGHEVAELARARGVDVTSGRGLDAALEGADVVVDVLNVMTTSRKASVGFFESTTRALLAAEARAGVGHHVALSIVGIDRTPLGYYGGKLAQETLIEAGDVPATILRATQFHEFAGQMLGRGIGPVVPVPPMRAQPVAAREVARVLLELAEAAPAGRAPDLAGPRVEDMRELVRRFAAARGLRALVLPIPFPGAAGRAMSGDGLLPQGEATIAGEDFATWLDGPDARAFPWTA